MAELVADETLWSDGEFTLVRARSLPGPPVLLLKPAHAQPSPKSLDRLQHALAFREQLDPAWAARPIELVQHRGLPALRIEDPGGEILAGLVGRRWNLTSFLRVGVGLAVSLGRLHRCGLVHKDVKPAHVLTRVMTGEVWLTGFGLVSRLPRERQTAEPPELIAGTLPYMAPEQTGRMNRSIDARSDLYACGVTLYEMLTGVLPFAATEPMDWIHCHVARPPVPAADRVDGLPAAVVSIVSKLLSKNAEDRYQTASGLKHDLRRCLSQWEEHGRIDPFPLGANDIPDQLLIPERLYGREREIEAMLAAFDRVLTSGTPEVVVVSGYSGIGKSSVVHELHKALVPPRGFFASGKFDQLKRDVPYAALAEALQGVVRALLVKSEAELRGWRDAVRAALGVNGQLVVNLIPDLEFIIGSQAPVAELPPTEAQNRFQTVLLRFVAIFARPEHPLVLFLDDLQWLDTSTLEFLEKVVASDQVRHLLLVGAYREGEVGPSHPLMRALAAIRGSAVTVHELLLAPLGADDVGRLVSDSLRCDRTRARPLSELVHQKTGGNPFFAIQFLMALHDEGLLTFDPSAAEWTWEMSRLEAKAYTDNVVELMVGKLSRLPPETLSALKGLACLGHRSDTETLALVQGTAPAAVDTALWAAVRAGLISQTEGSYGFLHDRVHEAAYSLIGDDERAVTHLRLGRLLAQRPSPRREEEIFDIVSQLNRGSTLMESSAERAQSAELNLLAGTRAKAATAYASALGFLAAGEALLAGEPWESRAELRFALALHRAECEVQTGALTAAEDRLANLALRASTPVTRAAVTCLRLVLYMAKQRVDLAVQACLDYLRSTGIEWEAHPSEEDVRSECEQMSRLLGGRPIEDLVDLPLMEHPERRATMDVLCAMVPAAIETDMNLAGLVIVRMANLSIEHGNTDASCYAYVLLNMVVGQRFGDHSSGYRFGQLSVDLVDRRQLNRFKSRVLLCFGSTIVPWMRHVRTGLPWMRRAFDAALESGDFIHGAYSRNNVVSALLASGAPLAEVEREAEHGLAFAQKTGFGIGRAILTGQILLVHSLRDRDHSHAADTDTFDHARFEQQLEAETGLSLPACWYWIRKMQARFYAEDYAAAADAGSKAEQLMWTSSGFFEAAEYHFYSALTRAIRFGGSASDEGARQLAALNAHHHQLAVWAADCPENFSDRAALVGAEIARLDGRQLEAMRLYEEAIAQAHQHGFVQNEALAHELAARACASAGLRTAAFGHLRNARYCYARWGADAKVRRLDEAHPSLREDTAARDLTSTIGASNEQFDLATVVNVSQAVSEEIRLDKLVGTIMANALAHAGAERGVLIVAAADEIRVEATATTTSGTIAVSVRPRAPASADLPTSVLDYVLRTKETVILDDASTDPLFSTDGYVVRTAVRSITCLPLLKQRTLTGVLYLENRLAARVFTSRRIAGLKLLASQAAISLENARLYADLQETGRFLAQAQQLSATGSFGWKPSTGDILWSDETYRIFDVDRLTKPTVALVIAQVHPDDRPLVEDLIARAPDDAKDWDLDCRLLLSDGTVRHLHVTAKAVRADGTGAVEFVGAVMDVTATKQSRQALEEAYDEIRALKDQLQNENLVLKEEIEKTSMFEEIVGTAPVLRALLSQIAMVAPTDSTVLITGETGTGKELVARAIHKRSRRAARAFVSVNCAAIPASLVASELFGHEKGAFTGAIQRRQGRFELAEGGTIFLDEVGELSADTQSALLRVLQEQEFERVGGGRPIRSDVRVIAATNRDLRSAVAENLFRADLYYRLNVFPVEVPPLRDRPDDIPLLVQYFTHRYATRTGKKFRGIGRKTLDLLRSYRWPGNIRELQNVIERAVIVSQADTLTIDERWLFPGSAAPPLASAARERTLSDQERAAIEAALAETKGRVAGPFGAAGKLGVPSTTLESKIKALGIDKRRFKTAPPTARS